jgi:hypothetical protein
MDKILNYEKLEKIPLWYEHRRQSFENVYFSVSTTNIVYSLLVYVLGNAKLAISCTVVSRRYLQYFVAYQGTYY